MKPFKILVRACYIFYFLQETSSTCIHEVHFIKLMFDFMSEEKKYEVENHVHLNKDEYDQKVCLF